MKRQLLAGLMAISDLRHRSWLTFGGQSADISLVNRGYGGKCLPKDVGALIHMADEHKTNADLMKAVQRKNTALRSSSEG